MRLFTDYQLAIIKFCAEECKRQGSGEESVSHMVAAYQYACQRWAVDKTILSEDIRMLGMLVDPERNSGGYRTQACHFGEFIFTPWQNIARSIESLVDAADRLDAVAFYTEFEKIHPFADGNGRVGAILYNLLRGTLYKPEAAPDVFKKEDIR